MSLRDRERFLRIKALRAERAAAALAAARAETEERVQALRIARIALETRKGMETRTQDRAYRAMVGQALNGAGFDTVDGTLIALSDATATADAAFGVAEANVEVARSAEHHAQTAAAAAHRAREVWDKLADSARVDSTRAAQAREDTTAEESVEIGTLALSGSAP